MMHRLSSLVLVVFVFCCNTVSAFVPAKQHQPALVALHVLKEPQQQQERTAEETTEQFGLEAGLFQSMKHQDGESAKSLLKRYGMAYLATSIPLALLSFALCYLLVDHGVDMQALLSKIGIQSSSDNTNSINNVGTLALAYGFHKALSPVRFPPTVLLTPVVAKMIGKEPNVVDDNDNDNEKEEATTRS